MKILDDWKVYGGVSDLKQHTEGIPVSQVIINSNYSDDHDDYDIALMKLSRPLTLSGETSQLAGLGLVFGGDRESLGTGRSKRHLGSPRSHPWGCCQLGHPIQLWPHHFACLSCGWELVCPPLAGPGT